MNEKGNEKGSTRLAASVRRCLEYFGELRPACVSLLFVADPMGWYEPPADSVLFWEGRPLTYSNGKCPTGFITIAGVHRAAGTFTYTFTDRCDT